MKVKNMNNRPNQFIIEGAIANISGILESGDMFQSYESNIVFKGTHGTYIDKNFWDYSTTTGRYRNQFLGENKKETQRKIDAGIYKLVDLNK